MIATDPTTGLTGRTIVLMSAGVTNDVIVTLLGQGNMTVTVRDGEEALVPGATLEVRQAGFPFESFDVVAGADGAYTLSGITVGDYSIAASTISGPTTIYGRSGVEVLAGETAQVTVGLEETGTIKGVFLEQDQATPVVSAQLSVGKLGHHHRRGGQLRGPWRAPRNLQDHGPESGDRQVRRGRTATLTEQGEVSWVTLLERASGELTGYVYDSDGATPLAGAFVTVSSSAPYAPAQTVKSDQSGIYSVPAIPAGGVTVTARHPTKDTVTGTATATLPEDYTYQLDVYMKPLTDYHPGLRADGETPATR